MIRRSCLGADVDFILVRFKLPAAWEGVEDYFVIYVAKQNIGTIMQ